MRTVVILLALVSTAAVAACEVVLPFDRTLIPPEGGLADGTFSGGDDSSTSEDSTTDAPEPEAEVEAGDAAPDHDSSAEEAGAGDGGADVGIGVDAAEASTVGDASDAAALD